MTLFSSTLDMYSTRQPQCPRYFIPYLHITFGASHLCVFCNLKLLSRGDSSAEGLHEVALTLMFQSMRADMEKSLCWLPTLPACLIRGALGNTETSSLHTHMYKTCTVHTLFISLTSRNRVSAGLMEYAALFNHLRSFWSITQTKEMLFHLWWTSPPQTQLDGYGSSLIMWGFCVLPFGGLRASSCPLRFQESSESVNTFHSKAKDPHNPWTCIKRSVSDKNLKGTRLFFACAIALLLHSYRWAFTQKKLS